MRVTQVTLSKHYKCGLPNFSNVTTGVSMSWEVGEGEEFNFDKGFDIINRQLSLQGKDTDQAWMRTENLKDSTKVTIKIPNQS